MAAPLTYWKNYPTPFYSDWASEPIPGWGVRPVMAGPARVGVGAVPGISAQTAKIITGAQFAVPTKTMWLTAEGAPKTPTPPTPSPPDEPKKKIPWWVWPAGAAIGLGALGWVGTRKGWF